VDSQFDSAKKLVESAIRKLGLDPEVTKAACPPGAEGKAAWTLKRGSASILVAINRHDEEKATYLRVASPVGGLPADAARHPALFRRLLELNAAGLANAAFGLVGERIVAVSERPTTDLDEGEVEQMIRHLAAVADTFDDRLEREFGTTKP
jgi:hypothetical protein